MVYINLVKRIKKFSKNKMLLSEIKCFEKDWNVENYTANKIIILVEQKMSCNKMLQFENNSS